MICLLIRHADTDALHHMVTSWIPGIHLSERGRAQARLLADRLARVPVAAVYSSPLERARETADAIAARHGLTVEVREDIGEVRAGSWAGRKFAELERLHEWKRFNSYRGGTRIPGGELMLEVQSRMVSGLEALRLRHGEEKIAVVSHGDPSERPSATTRESRWTSRYASRSARPPSAPWGSTNGGRRCWR